MRFSTGTVERFRKGKMKKFKSNGFVIFLNKGSGRNPCNFWRFYRILNFFYHTLYYVLQKKRSTPNTNEEPHGRSLFKLKILIIFFPFIFKTTLCFISYEKADQDATFDIKIVEKLCTVLKKLVTSRKQNNYYI